MSRNFKAEAYFSFFGASNDCVKDLSEGEKNEYPNLL